MPKLFSVKTLAEYLGVSKVTVKALLQARVIVGFKCGREWRVTEDAVKEYIKKMESHEN